MSHTGTETKAELTFGFNIKGPACFRKEGKWIIATFIPLQLSTQGRTREEAKKRLTEALVSYIVELWESGDLEYILHKYGWKKKDNVFKVQKLKIPEDHFILDVPNIPVPCPKEA